ncbi:hypothetical protein Nm8I071_46070 [Nonomuraea sp. TT08I-71]|nr:hypothetical protein Nm8I071_46070 [Nonomuraea sp. TT08I-71]
MTIVGRILARIARTVGNDPSRVLPLKVVEKYRIVTGGARGDRDRREAVRRVAPGRRGED